jgi:hypothetical protein
MKSYVGIKAIEAKPMTRGDYNKYRGWQIPSDENPADEGYLVVYEGNYESWSPKDVFEKAYHKSGEMSFSEALYALKRGAKIARSGWNGKGMFLTLQNGSEVAGDKMRNDNAKAFYGNSNVKICPHIDMKAADGSYVVGWLASQTDMLAEDWCVVE